jgi:hypothetical protein
MRSCLTSMRFWKESIEADPTTGSNLPSKNWKNSSIHDYPKAETTISWICTLHPAPLNWTQLENSTSAGVSDVQSKRIQKNHP